MRGLLVKSDATDEIDTIVENEAIDVVESLFGRCDERIDTYNEMPLYTVSTSLK